MSIFKAYDIRGLVPEEVNEEIARRIGAAFATFLDAKTLVVGRDMRTHSPAIQRAAIEGILATGCDVIDIGLASTPMAYYAIATLPCQGGLNVTASHNPGRYNGFKLAREGARPVSGATGIRDVEKLVEGDRPFRRAAKRGALRATEVLSGYAAHAAAFAGGLRELRISIDAANGMACHTLPAILERLPQVRAARLFFDLDGSFPNHEANPLKEENVDFVRRSALETKADVGISFDGDADRCVIVDERGETVPSDLVTAWLSRHFLKQKPGSAIVYDLRSSWVVPEEIQKAGGKPVRERVGHSFIKETMRREEAVFGGELSGHYYFERNFFCDSGEVAMAAILGVLSREGRPLSDVFRGLRRYHATGEINFEVEDKAGVIRRLRERFSDARQDELDGMTIAYGEPGGSEWWWCNVRPSNTEPLLRLNLEASSRRLMEEKKALLLQILGTPSQR